MAPDAHTTIEELLEVFPGRSVPRLCNEDKLVSEAGDSSGTQRKGTIHYWKPLPSSAVKIISLCVIVICKG
jgi:hypothetical protein